MRVHLHGYARAHTSLRRRAAVLVGIGFAFGVVATFCALAGAVALASTAKELNAGENVRWFIIALFLGLTAITGVIAGLFVWRGLVGRERARKLRALSVLARRQPVSSSEDVATSLRLPAGEAERLVQEAAKLGVIDSAVRSLVGADTVLDARDRAAQPDPMLGAVLRGTYQLEAHLGAGGMGTVYAARHLRTGRFYAVKMILSGAHAKPGEVKRFQREATAAGSLGHPHIVGVHDVDATPEGVSFLVMDIYRGETLRQRLARLGPLPFPEARRIALELASALGAAHAAGLLHRDVKPANVFLAEEGGTPPRAVLLDFGLEKRLDESSGSRLTTPGAAVGTPLYMSPEQARGEPLDPRSDVWALAAVLYEMTTGVPPYGGRTVADAYARLLAEPVQPASSRGWVPPALDAVLDRGLAKRREDRFADVTSLAAALAAIPAAPP